jgi:hypothetical protein
MSLKRKSKVVQETKMKREVDIIEIDLVKREDHTTSSRTTIKMVIQKPNLNTTGQIMYLTEEEAMLKVATEEEETVKVATEAEETPKVATEAATEEEETLKVATEAEEIPKVVTEAEEMLKVVTEADKMLKVATEAATEVEETLKVVTEAEVMLKVATEANLEDTITSKEMAQSIPFIINQEVHLVSKTNLKMIQISFPAETLKRTKAFVLHLQLKLLPEINLPKNQPETTLAVHRQEQEGVHK